MNNAEILQEFWQSYTWVDPEPIFYRLYYDDSGNPIVYTMEDLPGKYIEISQEQYHERDHRVKVKDGVIVSVPVDQVQKLTKQNFGTACHPCCVALVVPAEEPHHCWALNNDQND